MEDTKLKKYVVMSKFKHGDRFILEKQFVNRHSADHYCELMIEENEHDNLEFFLFEQSVAYNDKVNG
jgi:hypothetical protein|tara:strand:+ start:311 stop:511 length:201 start_codon:yes stop_codon:yes gene_type:complete